VARRAVHAVDLLRVEVVRIGVCRCGLWLRDRRRMRLRRRRAGIARDEQNEKRPEHAATMPRDPGVRACRRLTVIANDRPLATLLPTLLAMLAHRGTCARTPVAVDPDVAIAARLPPALLVDVAGA